ncbi:MAG: hypothetical protein ABI405_10155 [Parafilimonas sp.]
MFRKYSFFSILIFISTCFTSCIQFIRDHASGVWFYTYSSSGISSEFNLTPASFICLQPGNNYTLDFGKFEYGKWTTIGDTIILTASSGNTTAFIINSKIGKDLKLNTEPGVVCDFESQPYSFSKNDAAPFSLEDNKWRIHATHKETPAEIKMRLKEHCKFWKDYFTWALNNNIETVDVRSTPTPIKIYGNGFALKKFADLPAEWKSYFYDSTDCMMANKIIDDAFTHNDIAWAHTDNKYKMFIGAFEQLEQMLGDKIAMCPIQDASHYNFASMQ